MPQSTYKLEYGRHVARLRRRRRARAPAIHAYSYVDREKRVAFFLFRCMLVVLFL